MFTNDSARIRSASRSRRRPRVLQREQLERRMLLAAVTAVDPLANSFDASANTNVVATFDESVTAVTDSTFVLHRSQAGQLTGDATSVTAAGMTATHDPADSFFAGELVQATVTSGVTTTGGGSVSRVWEFRAGVSGGLGTFADSGQFLGAAASNTRSYGVQLGDLDNDGDLDIFVANENQPGRVYLNDGTGVFADSGQTIGSGTSREVELGDLDGDGDLDAVIVAAGGQANSLWANDGSGNFTQSQTFGGNTSIDVAIGDLDGDGDLDVFVANQGQANGVYRNDGTGNLTSAGTLGNHNSRGVELGDVDNDGDLDAYVVNFNQNARVWLNNGSATFTDSGQTLGNHESNGVALGDLDGDGDLDAIVANQVNADRIWFNDGNGVFTDSGQLLKTVSTGNADDRGIDWVLGDIDGDGDLDGVVGQFNGDAEHVYLNDGAGVFTDSGQRLSGRGFGAGTNTLALAIGDVDNDGDVDLVFANDNAPNGMLSQTRVFLNNNPANQVSLTIDSETISEAGGMATITATSSTAGGAVTVNLAIRGTATADTDYTLSADEIVIPAGATSASITLTAVDDTDDEPDETVVVEISGVVGGSEAGVQQVTATIVDDDEPPLPEVTLSVDNESIAEAAGEAIFTAALSAATTVPVTVNLAVSGTATSGEDFTTSATEIVIGPGETTGSVTVRAVDDELSEPAETVVIDIETVVNGVEVGTQQRTTTITDDDLPPGLVVQTLTSTPSGFVAQFTTAIETSAINLYDTEAAGLGPADIVVTGAVTGPVSGSLVIAPSAESVTFIRSGGPLEPDTYTVRLRSGADAFQDIDGQLLDGNGDGTPGDDFLGSFTIDPRPADSVVVGLPDFVRGPGQPVHLPADSTDGIPLTISDGENVRAVDVRVGYDPRLLQITGATVGADAPAGATAIVNTNTPGLAIVVFFTATALPAGSAHFVSLTAEVPADGAIYREQQVLDVHAVTVSDGNDNESPAIADDGFHLANYFGDVSGNGRVNASDASQVARFAALIDPGFAGSPNADPLVVGDPSGNGRINAADASLVARFAALIDVPQIPPIPGGITIRGVGSVLDTELPRVNRPLSAPATPPDLPLLWSPDAEPGHPAVDAVMAELDLVSRSGDVDPVVADLPDLLE